MRYLAACLLAAPLSLSLIAAVPALVPNATPRSLNGSAPARLTASQPSASFSWIEGIIS